MLASNKQSVYSFFSYANGTHPYPQSTLIRGLVCIPLALRQAPAPGNQPRCGVRGSSSGKPVFDPTGSDLTGRADHPSYAPPVPPGGNVIKLFTSVIYKCS